MNRKKIALLASILMATLVVGVYAMIVSNPLTANWTVKESQGNLVLSWAANEPTGDLNRGVWYYPQIRLQNVGAATYNVIVKFKVWIADSLPDGSVVIQGDWGTGWQTIASWQWDSELSRYVFIGTWGPAEGFAAAPSYDVTTQFRYMFESNAPVDVPYYFSAWVETVP